VSDAKANALVEPLRGISLHHAERNYLTCPCSVLNERVDDLGTDAFPLERGVDEQLRQEECAVVHEALNPPDVGAIDGDDPNLCHVPALAKTANLRVLVQVQLSNGRLHSRKIEAGAIVEV